jgi:hypothetical protein
MRVPYPMTLQSIQNLSTEPKPTASFSEIQNILDARTNKDDNTER